MPEALVTTALQRTLFAQRPAPGLIVPSDRGGQYVGNIYKQLLRDTKAQLSHSRAGDCYDNAQAESLWSRLKTEVLELRDWPVFTDLTDAQTRVADYFDYYNHQRRHSSIGYLKPYHFHQQLLCPSRAPAGGAVLPGPSNQATAPGVVACSFPPSKPRRSRMRQLKISKQITNRESQSLDKYLQEIGKVSLVTIDEEVDLAQRIRDGDQMALEKLTKANLRFVVSVSKQYQNQGLTLGDLINEGNLGLIKAAKRFDETKGFKFISYAVWWIRQSILQALAEQSRIVRLPLNRVGSLNKINRSFAELEQKFEREPSPDEIAELLELTTAEVVDTLKISGRHVSMDAPFVNGEENGLLDVLQDAGADTPDAGLLHDSLRREVQRALSTLTRREADVITLHFGLNGHAAQTLEEVGEQFSLTRERVRQIKEKAIRRLKHTSRSQSLKAYLG